MSCALCQFTSGQYASRTALIKQFVDTVNLLWTQVRTDLKGPRWSIARVTILEIGIHAPIEASPSAKEEGQESLLCTVQDVKDFQQIQPSIINTIAILCKDITSEETFRALCRKDALKNDSGDWEWGDWEGLKTCDILIEAYTTKWRGPNIADDKSRKSATIIEVESFTVVSRNSQTTSLSDVITKTALDRKVDQDKLSGGLSGMTSAASNSVREEPRRRKTITELLAPIGCTPGPTQSSLESDLSEGLSATPPQSEASLGKGLDESSSVHQTVARVSISTPLPMPSRSLTANKYPGPLLMSRANRKSDRPIEVDDSPPKAALPILYREVQRNKRARELLPAFDCELCRDWHEGMERCFPYVASDVSKIGACQCKAKKRPSTGIISRHRYNAAPSSTPSGYWDVKFPPTQAPPPTQDDD